jgi:hypothetical protein
MDKDLYNKNDDLKSKLLNKKMYRKFLYKKYINSDIKQLKYILNIYKMNELLQNKFNDNTELMDKYEDKIYTINGKKMNQVQRIRLELYNINKNIGLNDNLSDNLLLEIEMLNKSVKNLDKYNKVEIHSLKKQISDIQAKLNIKMKFLKASWDLSNDLYDTALNDLLEEERNKEKEQSHGRS